MGRCTPYVVVLEWQHVTAAPRLRGMVYHPQLAKDRSLQDKRVSPLL